MSKKSLPFIILCWALPAFDSYAENHHKFCGNITRTGSIITACCPGDKCCVCNDNLPFSNNCNKKLENCASKSNTDQGFTCYEQKIDKDRCVDKIRLWFQTIRWSRNESYHGVLVCSQYKVPQGGPWRDTCLVSTAKVTITKDGSYSEFVALCKAQDNSYVFSTLDLRTCTEDDVSSDKEGHLTCTSNPSKTKCTSDSSPSSKKE
jgi:hypothetical protein